MNLDASLSLDVVITILVIFGAVWRLDGKIAELRDKLEGEIKASRNELKGDIQRLEAKIDETRNELKGEIAESRSELKGDIQRLDAKIDETRNELKGDINWLGTRIENVDAKVDNGNQRLARLEGRFEGREERLTAEGDPAA
ncbi:MAG: hypothetical protein OXB89_01240 [Anaerolineaceae bacterium]|nr:hypothetical protein [Anaerolineaceae bacterium]